MKLLVLFVLGLVVNAFLTRHMSRRMVIRIPFDGEKREVLP